MKCLICGRVYLHPICKKCLEAIPLSPSTRLVDEMSVYCFYKYSDVEMLLLQKYKQIGARILKILAKKASKYFWENAQNKIWKSINLCGVGIDDNTKKGYSHTGVILNEFCKYGSKAIFGELIAKNKVRYAGKSLDFREKNPRGLNFSGKNQNLFIVDDIITTGTTFKEAKKIISIHNTPVFGIALCNARDS